MKQQISVRWLKMKDFIEPSIYILAGIPCFKMMKQIIQIAG